MKGSFLLSWLLSVMFACVAMFIFPESNFSPYWMLLRPTYLCALLMLIFALYHLIRSLRLLIAYLVEVPLKLHQSQTRVILSWLLLFLGWFFVIFFVFPMHTMAISSIWSIKEIVNWWKRRRRGVTLAESDIRGKS